ncbi:hypothetical protein [Aromatoleum aromaticum]|uniref:hypothetical protein n=1 Tax=Aromatoleum aromaticum TaxID=551760 RepID=UPI001697BB25|nr:hypothetical protein [Aromatoleum aromaticum]NMG53337.1 hypothetical protein [Aromatoleum aromaticum]
MLDMFWKAISAVSSMIASSLKCDFRRIIMVSSTELCNSSPGAEHRETGVDHALRRARKNVLVWPSIVT